MPEGRLGESQMTAIMKGLVLLWAAFFAYTAVMGLIDPASYAAIGLPELAGAAKNTVRADLSAFFLVSAGAAAVGALAPGKAEWLHVPAALFAMALLGRAIGVLLGDPIDDIVRTSMIAEGVSVVLLLIAARIIDRN